MPFYMKLGDIEGSPSADPAGGRLLTAGDLTGEPESTAKATFKEFTITKKTDTSSAGDGGGEIEAASFTWGEDARVAGVELPDLMVTSYQTSGHAGIGEGAGLDALLVADAGALDEAAIGANWRNYRVSVDSIE